MLSSMPMTEMPASKAIQIHIDDDTLSMIANEISQNEQAVSALKEGKRRVKEALKRGVISSPTPPDEYLIIYQIMNKFDDRYAGALGSEIIKFLQDELLIDEANPK